MPAVTSLIIAITITYFVTLLYIIHKRYSFEQNNVYINYRKIKFDEYKPSAGDIILVVRIGGRAVNQFITNSLFTHVAMVVKGTDDKYYMLDITLGDMLREGTDNYPYLRPIDSIRDCNNSYFVLKINKELTNDQNQNVLKILDMDYEYCPVPIMFSRWITKAPTKMDNRYQNCYDLVAIALDVAGLIDIKKYTTGQKSHLLCKHFGEIYHLG